MKYLLFLFIATLSYSQIMMNPRRSDIINPPSGGGGFDPSDLTPFLDLRYGVGMTKDATSGNVISWEGSGFMFENSDTTSAPQDMGDALFFVTGEARVLSRADDDELDLRENQDFTIEMWVYITGVGRIFHNRGSAPYWLTTATTSFRLQYSNGTNIPFIEADTVTTTDGWHHYVVTVDWAVGADIYIDGELKISEHTTEWTTFSTSSQGDTYIGRGDNPEGFGYVSDIRLYHSVLTQTNIDDLFAFGRSQ